MSGKNISEDEVKLIIDAESAKAQQAIHELEKESRKLQEENKARLDQMLKLEAAGQITEGRYSIHYFTQEGHPGQRTAQPLQ